MNSKNIRSWTKHIDFILLDLLALSLAFVISYYWRQNIGEGLRNDASYRVLYLAIITFHILTAFFRRSYSNIVRRGYYEELKETLIQNLVIFVCVLIYLVFTKQSELFSRFLIFSIFAQGFMLMALLRCLWKSMIRRRMSNSESSDRLLIITDEADAERLISRVGGITYQSYRVVGLILTNEAVKRKVILGVPVVGNKDTMMEYVRLNVVDSVLIQIHSDFREARKLAECFLDMGIVVYFDWGQNFETLPNQQITKLGELVTISTSIRTVSRVELFVKRTMDIAGALVGLVITGIATIFVAPAIYIKSPGPIFFSQERVGRNGRKFRIYKFRSMYLDAEERKAELMKQNQMQGFMFKMEDDPRIISGIGKFIRTASIDELPQFWNILRGDMSLVGTRPPTVDEFNQYELHHKIRLSFRPGLTGMWQVSGRSDILDFEEVVRLDQEYISNWSILLDVKIILKTIKVVLKREGSK